MSARLELLHSGARASIGINKADPLWLGRDLQRLEEAGVEVVHIDVMDGVFCPEMTVGPSFVKAVGGPFIKDVHLMIDDPLAHAERYAEAGADIVTFQVEATRHPHRVLQVLGKHGVLRGVALNPGTPLATVEPLLDELEYVLLLGINPGWSGQEIAANLPAKLAALEELRGDRKILLGVDGGVTRDNIAEVAALGSDLIVTGSAVFADPDPGAAARFMQEQIRAAGTGT